MTTPARRRYLQSLALAALACGLQGPLSAATDDDDLQFKHLWPLVEHARQPDGKDYAMVLFYLYHHTTNVDGSTYSFNILNYLQSPDFSAVLPLYYRYGPEGQKHTMLVPVYFQGPGYAGSPLLCTGGWTRADGGQSLWITPLFHRSTDRAGALQDLHVLNYIQGDGYKVLLPIAYQVGSGDRQFSGIIPAYFSGPGWWTVPPALTLHWQHDDGGSSTWITPFAHVDRDADGSVSKLMVLTYYHDHDSDILFPIAWTSGHGADRSVGVLPFWVQTPHAWVAPVALSGSWTMNDGGTSTWVTPLMHARTDHTGTIVSYHVLNYLHGHDLNVVFPIAWMSGPAGHRSGAVLPVYLQGEHWWMAPPILSGGSHDDDGSATTWITPLFHYSHDGIGHEWNWHVLTVVGGHSGGLPGLDGTPSPESSYFHVLPLFYHTTHHESGQDRSTTALIPCFYHNDKALVVPPLLSGTWQLDDGGRTTWLTPLYHRTTRADGTLSSMHVLTDLRGSVHRDNDQDGHPAGTDYHVLFPFYYQWSETAHGEVREHTGLLPVWMEGPDFTLIPPLMTWTHRTDDGGHSTWVTPLFHIHHDQNGQTTSLHVGPYIQAGDTQMVLPLAYRWGKPGDRHLAIAPLFVQGPNFFIAPLALSAWHREADGSQSTWVTPLVHVASTAAGTSVSVTPVFYSTPTAWVVPPALTAHWTRDDGGSNTWVTPLAHVSRDATGTLENMHVLNYVHTPTSDVFLPLAWRSGAPDHRHYGVLPFWMSGPGYAVSPVLLSWWRERATGGGSLWVTPLMHRGSDGTGAVTDWHVLNVIHSGNTDVVLPLAWRTGDPSHRSYAVLPAWFSGTDYWVCPPLLTGALRNDDGGHSLWVTPLMHRTTAKDGSLTNWHVLNLVHSGNTDFLVPLAWSTGLPDARTHVVLPLYVQGPGYQVLAPVYYNLQRPEGQYSGVIPIYAKGPDRWVAPLLLSGHWRSENGRATTMLTPLYHHTTADGVLCHMHVLNYIQTPEISTCFPIYWEWGTHESGRSALVLPFYYQHHDPNGDMTASLLPLLFSYHRGHDIDTSISRQLMPFLVQNADHGHEINILWRLFHWRANSGTSEIAVGPLWWSEAHHDAPFTFQILGGLIARTCNEKTKTTRYSTMWGMIPLGSRTSYASHPGSATDATDATEHDSSVE